MTEADATPLDDWMNGLDVNAGSDASPDLSDPADETTKRVPAGTPKRGEQLWGLFYSLMTEQSGQCAVCKTAGTATQPLFVDHDHSDGIVRGLLCNPCNTGLGFFRDNIESLASAIEYLRESPASRVGAPVTYSPMNSAQALTWAWHEASRPKTESLH